MIVARDIAKVFGQGTSLETKAVDGISLDVGQGEFVSVIGSNGSGKTTFLKILSGELSPSNGSIEIDAIDVTKLDQHLRARMIALVSQDPLAGTCADLTIAENMSLASMRGKKRGISMAVSSLRQKDYAELLSKLGLGLENRLDDKVGLLSGGQRQALCLIMTTLSPSKVLLLDEHTAALDPRMSSYVLSLTESLYKEYNLTVLMVTHSMSDAIKHGKRLLMMHQGEIVIDMDEQQKKEATPTTLFTEFERRHAEDLQCGAEIPR